MPSKKINETMQILWCIIKKQMKQYRFFWMVSKRVNETL